MSCDLTPFAALQAALTTVKTQQALADICGVSQTAVWKWLQSSKRLPAEYVLRVEAATGVSRHDLRPDIYPREEMVDHFVADRFCGIDQQIAARAAPRRAAASKAA